MQKFWILGIETFAWNSSHHRGSGPQTQTRIIDLFRNIPVQTLMRILKTFSSHFKTPAIKWINFPEHLWVVKSETYGFGEFFPRTFRPPLSNELIFRSTCELSEVKITDLENFFLALLDPPYQMN